MASPTDPGMILLSFKLCCCSAKTYLGSQDLLHMYLTLGGTHSITSTIKCRASSQPRERGVGTERGGGTQKCSHHDGALLAVMAHCPRGPNNVALWPVHGWGICKGSAAGALSLLCHPHTVWAGLPNQAIHMMADSAPGLQCSASKRSKIKVPSLPNQATHMLAEFAPGLQCCASNKTVQET